MSENETQQTIPPPGLEVAGATLWVAVLAEFDLRPDERRVLRHACKLADEIARLEEALDEEPTLVPGSAGQLRSNPLFKEVRDHRLAMARLLQQLGLKEAGDEVDGTVKSDAGRKLARMRWGN